MSTECKNSHCLISTFFHLAETRHLPQSKAVLIVVNDSKTTIEVSTLKSLPGSEQMQIFSIPASRVAPKQVTQMPSPNLERSPARASRIADSRENRNHDDATDRLGLGQRHPRGAFRCEALCRQSAAVPAAPNASHRKFARIFLVLQTAGFRDFGRPKEFRDGPLAGPKKFGFGKPGPDKVGFAGEGRAQQVWFRKGPAQKKKIEICHEICE